MGGEGDELRIGGTGQDVLIGGFGDRELVAHSDEGILIHDITATGVQDLALQEVLEAWTV